MATTASLKVVKSFTYRGVLRQFSNRYHFDGGAPSDNAHWTTLSDAITNAEKAIFSNIMGVNIVASAGYAAGSDVPVFTKTYAVAATGVFTGAVPVPGDVAGLIRYSTAARTSKNHPVYLFNYYHTATRGTAQPNDELNAAQSVAMQTYAAAWITGFSDGTTTHHRAGPNGAAATGYLVEPYLTHRDLPRR